MVLISFPAVEYDVDGTPYNPILHVSLLRVLTGSYLISNVTEKSCEEEPKNTIALPREYTQLKVAALTLEPVISDQKR